VLITSFGDGVGSKLKAAKQLPFAVHRKPFATQAPAKLLLQNPSKQVQRQPKNAEF
jgi:hypothetical protein